MPIPVLTGAMREEIKGVGWKELEHEDWLEYLSLTKENRILKAMSLSSLAE